MYWNQFIYTHIFIFRQETDEENRWLLAIKFAKTSSNILVILETHYLKISKGSILIIYKINGYIRFLTIDITSRNSLMVGLGLKSPIDGKELL